MGHVTKVSRGVSVTNATVGAQGLPNVDPVYTWVRLAQRVPVRIAIDDLGDEIDRQLREPWTSPKLTGVDRLYGDVGAGRP